MKITKLHGTSDPLSKQFIIIPIRAEVKMNFDPKKGDKVAVYSTVSEDLVLQKMTFGIVVKRTPELVYVRPVHMFKITCPIQTYYQTRVPDWDATTTGNVAIFRLLDGHAWYKKHGSKNGYVLRPFDSCKEYVADISE